MTALLIHGGLVADPASDHVALRDLLIEDSCIVAVGAPGTLVQPGAARHDAGGRLILPGLVNAHTHGHANLMKGVADRWTLEASLTHGPWLGGERDPETIYLSTLLGAVDMVSKGCTACFDLVYEFPRPTPAGMAAAAHAYADIGMRAVLAPMIADLSLFQAVPSLLSALPGELRETVRCFDLDGGEATIAAVEAIAQQQGSLPPRIQLAIAPTIPHHCSDSFLLRCVDIADRHRLPIHMHIGESRLQSIVAQERYGKSAVAHLDDLAVLRPGFTAAHAVWLNADDLDRLARRGCAVAHIPASNLRLGSGFADIRPMLDRGITVGLATDGANSSDALSVVRAMRLASYGARAFAGPREAWLTAAETARLATAGGAELLGLQAGRIVAGGLADLTFFDLHHIDFTPLNDALNQLVTSAGDSCITDTMVGGRFVYRAGRIVSDAAGNLQGRVQAAVTALAAATAGARTLAARLEPHVVAFAESFLHSLPDRPIGMERLIPRHP